MALLQVKDLNFTYPDGHRALTDVSLALPRGSFTLLCGASGSGKSTLLRLLKTPIAPTGQMSGEMSFDGKAYPLSERESATQIGFVGQDPDAQIVTDRVWQELAFGLENLGLDSAAIRRRVGEMASYFGLESWYHRETDTLSGGQKQLLNLAATLVMRPTLLLLDEPTAQLDPIAATEFLATLRRLNRDMGITVLMTEHRLEETLPSADGVIVLDDGKVAFAGEPRAACAFLRCHPLAAALPAATRIWSGLEGDGDDCPLTVQEGQRFLASLGEPATPPADTSPVPTDTALRCRDAWFRYDKSGADILRGVSLTLGKSEVYSLLGGNGAGKTTLLYCLAGMERLYKGKIKAAGRAAFLPQDPRQLFACETVREELAEMAADWQTVAEAEGIAHLLDRHPYDLSGGEQQRVALAKLLLTSPDILLLDEPTKGLDAACKQALVTRLRELAAGTAVLAVTHDADFAAEVSDRCGLLFDGEIVSEDTPRRFFGDNCFYTTAASRMSRERIADTVTCAQVIDAWAER